MIKRATLADKPEIFKFIQKAYLNIWQYRIPDRWEWEFVNNPHLDNTELPVFIAVDRDGKVVGQSCALIEKVKIGSEIYKLGWGVDAFVLPEYRGQGIGMQLQKANDEAHAIFMSLSMAKSVRKMKLSLGSTPIDPLPVFRRYQRFSSDIFRNTGAKKKLKNQLFPKFRLMTRLIKIIATRFFLITRNFLSDIMNHYLFQKNLESLALTAVEIFPEDIDQLWEKLNPKFYAIIKRDRIHLNWKYVDQPNMNYLRVIARKKGEICGYIIFRNGKYPERKFGMISDIFVDPEDSQTIFLLLYYAMSHFRKEKVTEIIAATTVLQYQYILKKFGFVETGEELPVIHSTVEGLKVEPDKWFLGNSDHDWDQYPVTR